MITHTKKVLFSGLNTALSLPKRCETANILRFMLVYKVGPQDKDNIGVIPKEAPQQ